jgi:hypothetical protein
MASVLGMAKKEPTKYDPLILSQMVEPLLVYVERNEHGKAEPIPIPALYDDGKIDPNGTPGHNWSRDAAAKLQWWLRDFWSGGGSYYAKVQDTAGKMMDWDFVIPPRDSPIRQVLPLAQAASVPSPVTAQAMPSAQMQGMGLMRSSRCSSPSISNPRCYPPSRPRWGRSSRTSTPRRRYRRRR